MIVKSGERLGNLEMIEKLEGVAGVLAGNEISFTQGLDGTEGDVAQIPDRSWNEGEHGG